jgi:uncharacterized protein
VYHVRVHGSARAFLDRAAPWLLRHEDRNNLMLSLAYARTEREAEEGTQPFFATVESDDRTVGCALRTPPHKVLVTDMPVEAAPVLAAGLAVAYDRIPAVLGPGPVAERVAAEWVRVRGGGWRSGMAQGIYRVDEVTPPSGVPGRMRSATEDDLELGVAWGDGFARDSGIRFGNARASVAAWIEKGALHLWESDGEPVSIAVAHGRTPCGVRIGYVYTPPERRGRGYASGLVAALSQRMLDSGLDFCVLYTDLANPTSNAIYRRLGYELLEEVRDVDLVDQELLP